MKRIYVGLTVLWLLTEPAMAVAQDVEEANLEFFYPIVTRRPVIERELEFKLEQSKSREGHLTELSAAIEWPVLPRWQIELEVPFVINFPSDAATTGGPGDLEIENKFLLYRSVENRLLVAAGFTTTLPSGSEHKGLGGELAVEPFVTAAIALGPFDLLAEASYKWTFDPEKAQEFDGGLAAAWPLSRWFTPFIELRATKPTVAEDHRPQVAVVPGLNMKPFPRSTLAVGVQLPVTSAREFDYQVRVLFIREF
jgi:hypothetical protein